MLKLTITEKGGETKTLTFDKDEILIGRVQGNDIVLPKGNISKRHSKIAVENGGYVISDLKSTNGTYVNGRKIADPTAVSAADKVYIGDFVVVLDDAALGAGRREPSISGRRSPPPPPARGPQAAAAPARHGLEEDDALAPAAPARPTRSQPRIPAPPPPPPPPRRPVEEPHADSMFAGTGADDLAPPAPSELGSLDDSSLEPAAAPAHAPVASSHELDDEGMGSVPTANRHSPALVDPMDIPTPAPVTPSAPAIAAVAAPASAAAERALPTPLAEAADAATLLDSMIDDASVSAITVMPGTLLVERSGRRETIPASLSNRMQLIDSLRRIAEGAVPPPAPDQSLVDVALPDGTRVTLILPPLGSDVLAVIRKPRLPARSFAELVSAGAASRELEQVLTTAATARLNLLVTGDTEAVAEVVSAISGGLPTQARLVGIGATPPQAHGSWVAPSSDQDLPAIVRALTAFRPEHFVVPTLSTAALPELLLAAAAGQDGLLMGLQGRSALDALYAAEAMAIRAMGPHGVRELLARAIDIIVHATSIPGAGLRIVDVSELKVTDGKLSLDTIVSWRTETGGKTAGKFQISGVSSRLAGVISGRGGSLPPTLRR